MFVIKFVEMIVNCKPSSTENDIKSRFRTQFADIVMSQSDAYAERVAFIKDIEK